MPSSPASHPSETYRAFLGSTTSGGKNRHASRMHDSLSTINQAKHKTSNSTPIQSAAVSTLIGHLKPRYAIITAEPPNAANQHVQLYQRG
jgi:hypothetical protein